MNRFFLIITPEKCSEKEKKQFVNFLNTSLLKSNAENASLEPLSTQKLNFYCHLTVPRENKEYEWLPLPEDIEKIFETDIQLESQSNDEGFDIGESIFLSQLIHKLSDALPPPGTFYMDALMSYNLISNAELSNHILLIGALSRLRSWHNGLISILLDDSIEQCHIKDFWRMKAQIVKEGKHNFSPLLWRGSIELPPQGTEITNKIEERWELKPEFKEVDTRPSYLDNKDSTFESNCRLLLSPCLELLDECALSSVPLYTLSLPVLQLNLINDTHNMPNHISPLLEYLRDKHDVALILRLKYKKVNKSHLAENTYTTQQWRKFVLSGSKNGPELNFIDPSGHFIFAATKHRHKENVLTLYLLQLHNFNTEYFSSVMKRFNIPLKSKEQNVDPCDWPERLYLLNKQIESDKNKQNVVAEIPPALMQINSVYFSAQDVHKYFADSGEANETENMEIVLSKNKDINSSSHDIYYNSELDEEKQNVIDKLKRNYIVYETASSFSTQPSSNHTMPIRNSSSPVPLPFATRRMNSISRPKDSASDKGLNAHGSVPMASSSRSKKTQQAKMARSMSFPMHKTSARTVSRKLTRVEKLRNSRTPALASDDLDERHKMKLREAVVFALEKHDIGFNHSLFKSCARKLFAVCRPFVKDVVGKGCTSAKLKAIADSYAKQVVDFEVQKVSQ